MIKEQDKLFLRKLYILFGDGFPYFKSTLQRIGIKPEFSVDWTATDTICYPEYFYHKAGDGKTWQEWDNLLFLTERGVEWIMED